MRQTFMKFPDCHQYGGSPILPAFESISISSLCLSPEHTYPNHLHLRIAPAMNQAKNPHPINERSQIARVTQYSFLVSWYPIANMVQMTETALMMKPHINQFLNCFATFVSKITLSALAARYSYFVESAQHSAESGLSKAY